MVKLTKFTKFTCLNLIKSDKPSNCKQIKKNMVILNLFLFFFSSLSTNCLLNVKTVLAKQDKRNFWVIIVFYYFTFIYLNKF